MKKTLLFLATLTLGVACSKNLSQTTEEPQWDGPTGKLLVKIGTGADTKVADVDMQEHKVNNVQVFIFDTDGKLETDKYAKISNGSATPVVELISRIGQKTVYTICNAPRLHYRQLSDLEGALSDLADNKVNNLVMSGKKVVDVEEFDNNSSTGLATQFTVYVKKLAAAIQLGKVQANFTATDLEGSTFKLKEIYVKNVVGRAPYGVQTEGDDGSVDKSKGLPNLLLNTDRINSDYWYNKITLDSTPLPLTVDVCNLTSFTSTGAMANYPTPPVQATIVDVNHTLYVYPNSTVADPESVPGISAGDYTPRHTRLVLHALITASSTSAASFVDKDFYYTFDLPVLEANKKYKVNVVITMLGKENDNDDSKTLSGQAKPVISVSDWDSTTTLTYDM